MTRLRFVVAAALLLVGCERSLNPAFERCIKDTCAGCCDATGQCMPSTVLTCGDEGVACIACRTGEVCDRFGSCSSRQDAGP